MKYQIDFDNQDVYNLDYLSMVTGDDNSMMQELAMHIFVDSPVLVENALVAATNYNWTAVAQTLHKLKGQLGILSMKKTIDYITYLEELCKKATGEDEKINTGLKDLQHSIPLIFNRIQLEIGSEK